MISTKGSKQPLVNTVGGSGHILSEMTHVVAWITPPIRLQGETQLCSECLCNTADIPDELNYFHSRFTPTSRGKPLQLTMNHPREGRVQGIPGQVITALAVQLC